MTFLSAKSEDLLSLANITLYLFLPGNVWLYVWAQPGDPPAARKAKARAVFGALIAIGVVLAEAGLFYPGKTGAAPGALDFVFAALNGVLAVLAGAIASTITSAASEKSRSSFGFAPRSENAPGDKPLISSWL